MSNNIGGQIISELGEIGKKVGSEVVQIPKDITGKALESLGASSGSKTQKPFTIVAGGEGQKPATAWEKIDGEKDRAIKRQMARRALEELTKGETQRPKEPSLWERLAMEEDQKKRQMTAQKVQAGQVLQMPSSKRKRGDLYGTQAKKTATENRSIRQD